MAHVAQGNETALRHVSKASRQDLKYSMAKKGMNFFNHANFIVKKV